MSERVCKQFWYRWQNICPQLLLMRTIQFPQFRHHVARWNDGIKVDVFHKSFLEHEWIDQKQLPSLSLRHPMDDQNILNLKLDRTGSETGSGDKRLTDKHYSITRSKSFHEFREIFFQSFWITWVSFRWLFHKSEFCVSEWLVRISQSESRTYLIMIIAGWYSRATFPIILKRSQVRCSNPMFSLNNVFI